MTTSPQATQVVYELIGANLGPFATVFGYESHDDIEVHLDLGAGYSLIGAPADYQVTDGGDPIATGGTIMLTSPGGDWPASSRVAILRITAQDQAAALGQETGFSPQKYEAALDHLSRQVQDLQGELQRMVKMGWGDDTELAAPATRADKILGFANDGSLAYYGLLDLSQFIATGILSAANITFNNGLTGGLTRTGTAKMGDVSSARDFTSIAQADAHGQDLFTPSGVWVSTVATGAALAQNYWGPGQVKTADNNKRGKFFSHIAAAPAVLADHDSIETAFSGDVSHSIFQIEHRITGAATLGQPAAGYVYTEEAYPIYAYLRNESGYNHDLGGNGGRTGCNLFAGKVEQFGQGDCTCFNGRVVVGSTRAGATNFLANPAGVLFNGDMFATADGVYLNARELIMHDNGYDVAAIGDVVNLDRTNETGAKSVFWGAYRAQSQGTKAGDSVLSATGPFKVGVDFAIGGPTVFDANQAALSLYQGQRIYFNNAAPASGSLDAGWRTTQFNGWYMSYNIAGHGVEIVANGSRALICTADHVGVDNYRFYANASLTVAGACPATAAGQIAFGGDVDTHAGAGAGEAVPATVAGYMIINVAGTFRKIPYFDT